MKTTLYFLLFFCLLVACSNETRTNALNSDSLSSFPPGASDIAGRPGTVLNNIILEEKGGLKISTAFLADESGNLINAKNTIGAGKPVFLTLLIHHGWRVENGFVLPGARQNITTHNGEPVLQSGDLFATEPRIKYADAATIRLKAVIMGTRADIAFYTICFRVWDKKGAGEIAGHYRLQIEK